MASPWLQNVHDNLDGVNKAADQAYKDLKDLKIDLRSIVTRGKYAIFYFPVYISEKLTIEEAHAISKLYERVYADFVQNVLSQNNTVEYEDLIDDMRFLRKYHTNINESKEVVEKYFGDKPMDFTEKCILSSLCKVGKYFGNKNVMVEYFPGENSNMFYQEHMQMIQEPLKGFSWLTEANTKINLEEERDKKSKAKEEARKADSKLQSDEAMAKIQKLAGVSTGMHSRKDEDGNIGPLEYDFMNKETQEAYQELKKQAENRNEELAQIDEELKQLKKQQSEIIIAKNKENNSKDDGWNRFEDEYEKVTDKLAEARKNFKDNPSSEENKKNLEKAEEAFNKVNQDMAKETNKSLYGAQYASNQERIAQILQQRKEKLSSVADARARLYTADSMLKVSQHGAAKAQEELMKAKINAKFNYKYSLKTKAAQVVKDTDIKKINAALPYNITAQFKVLHGPDDTTKVDKDVVEVNIGVKVMLHIIKPDDLIGEAKDIILSGIKSLQKLRYKSGEISFTDWLFGKDRIKKAVQNSVKGARWISTLRRLANYKVTAQTMFKDVVRATNNNQVPIPNATLVLTALDVDDIKLKTGFDFTKVKIVKRFCSQMFMISFMIVDASGSVIKMIYPEEQNDWDTMSMTAMEDLLKRSSSADFLKEMRKAVNR